MKKMDIETNDSILHNCLKPVAQLEPNFDGTVIGCSSSKIVSGSDALPPRWPPQCSCVVIESSFDPGMLN
jgi:hypothetical protein